MDNKELRRLMELAAKAHGHIASDGIGGFYDMERGAEWAPHLDDGDSRRLEVALCLEVGQCPHSVQVGRIIANEMVYIHERVSAGDDRYA